MDHQRAMSELLYAKHSPTNVPRNSFNTPLVLNNSLTHTTVQVVPIKLELYRGLNETVRSASVYVLQNILS